MKYPDTYLHVLEQRSGQTWIVPIGPDEPLAIEERIAKWVESEYCGELEVDLPFADGCGKSCVDYYARTMTDGRPPDSVICWESIGFFLKPTA